MFKILDTESGLASEVNALRNPRRLKAITSELGWRIFLELSKSATSSVDLSRKLKIHEQKVYYHINQLRKAELIKLIRTEERQGGLTKFYTARPEALVIMHENMESHKFKPDAGATPEALKDLILSGRVNFKVVVGSPDPHGKYKARGSDSCCAIDLALFLGSFTNSVSAANYKLDTEMRENDYKQNLIVVGGPKANMLTAILNETLKVRMDESDDWNIVSKLSGKSYGDDDNGFIAITQNPWDKSKKVIVFAGRRFPGTRATVIAFVKHINEIMKGNKYDPRSSTKVVKGIDYDGDGVVDDVEFLE